jgi:hypothetical protein
MWNVKTHFAALRCLSLEVRFDISNSGSWVLQECEADALKEQGLESSDSLSVALCLCCIFGLGQPAMVLMEQGARLDMPLSEDVAAHICSFARKRGLVVCERDMVGATALHMSALCGHPGKPP